MRKILITLFFLPLSLFCQTSGIPEQDSLLEKKDRLLVLNILSGGKYQLEYDWLDFQWHQWVKGKKERLCMFLFEGKVEYVRCFPDMGIVPSYSGDTLIHRPLPISFEAFMEFRLSKVR